MNSAGVPPREREKEYKEEKERERERGEREVTLMLPGSGSWSRKNERIYKAIHGVIHKYLSSAGERESPPRARASNVLYQSTHMRAPTSNEVVREASKILALNGEFFRRVEENASRVVT